MMALSMAAFSWGKGLPENMLFLGSFINPMELMLLSLIPAMLSFSVLKMDLHNLGLATFRGSNVRTDL